MIKRIALLESSSMILRTEIAVTMVYTTMYKRTKYNHGFINLRLSYESNRNII